MKTFYTVLSTLAALMWLGFTNAVLQGWYAQPDTAYTVHDAVSICTRAVFDGRVSVLDLDRCIDEAVAEVLFRQEVAKALWHGKRVEEAFEHVEESARELTDDAGNLEETPQSTDPAPSVETPLTPPMWI